MTTTEQPVRAARYARISDDKAGDEHGVINQLADEARAADARGYVIVRTEVDNDISATNGKHRPGYEAVMAAARRGEIDAILVFQTSRFWRNRRERAEGIDILRKAGVSIIATKGPSLDMSTAYGRAMAGLLGEFDTLETDVKAERQQLANEHAAKAGKPRRATGRPFGWLENRVTADPAEKAAVEDACRALLAGGSVAGVMREWMQRGVRPHQAPFGPLRRDAWTATSVRKILRSPRNAGIAVYRAAEVGRGKWEPLVLEETYRAVVELLADPGRKTARGVTSMLGGLALCQCGNYVTGSRNGNGDPTYRCNQGSRGDRPGPHVAIPRSPVDKAIGALAVARLSKPDAADLLAPQAKIDVIALRDEAQAIRARLAALGRLFIAGQIEEQDVVSGRGEGKRRLAEIESELAEAGRESVLAPIIAAENAGAEWKRIGDDRRRAIVDALMEVTLHPVGRGTRVFDPEKVLGIRWTS